MKVTTFRHYLILKRQFARMGYRPDVPMRKDDELYDAPRWWWERG